MTERVSLELPRAEGLEPYATGRGWAIYCADVLDLVPRLPAGCLDVVLVDPPSDPAADSWAPTSTPTGAKSPRPAYAPPRPN
jgi:hypothetical protein